MSWPRVVGRRSPERSVASLGVGIDGLLSSSVARPGLTDMEQEPAALQVGLHFARGVEPFPEQLVQNGGPPAGTSASRVRPR